MPSNHCILCRPLLLLPSFFPSIRVFSNESLLHIRWPKYWSFSFSISPSNEYSGLISFRMDWLDLLAVQGTLKSLLQHHSSKASIIRGSLSDFTLTFHFQALEKEMATHSSILAWRIPLSEEPGGLQSMGLQVQFSSVAQSCPILCNPMNLSTPGLQLPESTQTHVHRVGDAIQPSHPLLSPFPPVVNISQHQGLFQ